ncbi:uncharacterized protein LOC143299566 isoform X5 [Babylonia areolata]|uniref:uncharacterized protein LOC143299566 isoform X5 n=1 Tax=Babylonia areolata TaxID=304850 RepID=UPI003FCF2FFC
MEKLDEDSAAKFINALIKSLQTLCHGYLNFDNGIEIVGHINLNVDKGSSMHYILEEKVCKNEENSTLFISNSFHAQNQNSKSKGKDSDTVGNRNEEKTSSADLGQAGKLSAISSISSALSKSHEKNRSGSTSSAKDSENLHSKPLSSTAKRKASDDYTNDVRAAKQAQLCSSPSPVSHFLSQSPHDPSGSSSPVDTKPSLRQLHGDESSGTVLPQTAAVSSDNAGDLGVNLVGSVLERVDDQSNSDLQDRGDDSDGDLEVTFIKEEYVEGEQSACQFENSGGQQYGRGTLQRASSSDMSDGSMYPVSLHHSQSASSTFVPSSHDLATAQHYGPSTSSQPQPGTSGIRGAYPPESHDSSACDQKILEATQLFKGNLSQHQPPQPVPAGLKPGCGYVHPSDAQKWMRGPHSIVRSGMKNYPAPLLPHASPSAPKDVAKEDLQRLLQQKLPLRKIAAVLEISRPTLYKLLRKHGLDSAFKNITNEKLVAKMQAIVAECPEAGSDPNMMMAQLRQQDFFVGMQRVVFCMQKYLLGGCG